MVLDFDEKKKKSKRICRRREKWKKEGDASVGLENQGHRLVDRRQATQVVKFGDRRSCHVPAHEGQRRRMDLLVEACGPVRGGA